MSEAERTPSMRTAMTYYNWKDIGQATFDGAQEGPNVFEFGGKYWLIADEWRGLAIYSSDDLTVFTRQEAALGHPL